MKKFYITLVYVLCLVCLPTSTKGSEENIKIIGLTQIAEHPTLNLIRKGVEEGLRQKGYGAHKAKIVFENPHGDLSKAIQIAQKFTAIGSDIIIAIGTPSAQTAVKATQKTQTPVVFVSITDPVGAHLIQNLEHPEHNVTGIRQPLPIKENLDLLQQLLPNAHKIGVILNYGEVNSVKALEKLEKFALEKKLKIISVGLTKPAEIAQSFNYLKGKIDVLFLLQDNTVASALPYLMKVAIESKIPVIATYEEAVKSGAIGSIAYDEYAIGYQAGVLGSKILDGVAVSQLPVEDPQGLSLTLNPEIAKVLGITVPEALLKQAKE